MLIIFSVNDQKITHDLKGQLVAGSVDIVQAAFKFDSSWDELDKIVVSAEVDLTSYATRESVAKADDGLIKGIYNNMTASSEKYLGSGNLLLFWTLLKSLLNGHESSINDLLARVKLLELILSADVTGNPYYVTFNTLTDVVVSSGIWNKSDGRIEF